MGLYQFINGTTIQVDVSHSPLHHLPINTSFYSLYAEITKHLMANIRYVVYQHHYTPRDNTMIFMIQYYQELSLCSLKGKL